MSEYRVDHDLPAVGVTDDDVLEKVAGYLGQVVDFAIPGFGIIERSGYYTNHVEAHRAHKALILAAVELVKPEIATDEDFRDENKNYSGKGSEMHVDRILSAASGQDIALPGMFLRLHTADQYNGAEVTLANAKPGISASPDDEELFRNFTIHDRFELQRRGYDFCSRGTDGPRYKGPAELLRMIKFGSYDPIVVQKDIYYYWQQPLSSVVFRTTTDIGPNSVHGFDAIDPDVARIAYISDLKVYAQCLGEPETSLLQ